MAVMILFRNLSVAEVQGRGSQEESKASRVKMLIEILDYRGCVLTVFPSQCFLGGALILHGLYSVLEIFGVCATG